MSHTQHTANHSPAPTTGCFKAYDSQLPIPGLQGHRVVKCLYKVAKTGANAGKAAAKNSYIHIGDTITAESVQENLSALMPHIVGYLQEIENEIVKGKHKAGTIFVSDAALGLEAVVEKLEEKTVRVNKEMVEAWFDDKVLDGLVAALTDKMGISGEPTEEELAKLGAVADMYKGKYAALAGGKTSYPKEDAETLQLALVRVGVAGVEGVEGDTLGARFYQRLEAMKNKSENLLLSL